MRYLERTLKKNPDDFEVRLRRHRDPATSAVERMSIEEQVVADAERYVQVTLAQMFPLLSSEDRLNWEQLLRPVVVAAFRAYEPNRGMSWRSFVITQMRWQCARLIRHACRKSVIPPHLNMSFEQPVVGGNGRVVTVGDSLIDRDPTHVPSLDRLLVSQLLATLETEERQLIIDRFGLESGSGQSVAELAAKRGVSRQAMNNKLERLFKRLADEATQLHDDQ